MTPTQLKNKVAEIIQDNIIDLNISKMECLENLGSSGLGVGSFSWC